MIEEVETKKWFQSKTFWVGVLEVVIGMLGLVAQFLEGGNFAVPGIVALVAGILTIVMRRLTDTPMAF
jgi:uncharacterized membrane protein